MMEIPRSQILELHFVKFPDSVDSLLVSHYNRNVMSQRHRVS